MNLKELTWPVRIYWDLPPVPSDSINCLKICEEIIEIKILFLSIQDTASTLSPSCPDIIGRLKGKNIAISLTIASSALTPQVLSRLSDTNIKKLLVNVSSFDEALSAVERIGQYRKTGLLPGISFDIGEDNYEDIPDVVSLCLNSGIPDLVFPIQRLESEKDFFYIDKMQRESLSLKLHKTDYREMQITIHDPFLWTVFYPEADYHEGGCQAANSMLYISPAYKVYPCPAMPVELGDLRETTLREIILSEKKKELRSSLLKPPVECAACEQVNKCLGGCRGRAYSPADFLSLRDPACK